MKMIDWDITASILEDKLGIPRQVLDYIAVKDILLLCSSGSSNATISQFLNTDLNYVVEVIEEVFLFQGWSEDLDINPYQILCSIYNQNYINPYIPFQLEVETIAPFYLEETVTRMFIVANTYYKIEKEMEKYWI